MDGCTHLTRRRHADGARPVVVHVRHLVGETLKVVNLPHLLVVTQRDVVRRADGALVNVLRHEEEVDSTTNREQDHKAVISHLILIII